MSEGVLPKVEALIGYSFKNLTLLENALTHASTGGAQTYERLEFLGDRVLGLVVADHLYRKFPKEPEGDLARRLSALVQGETLAKIARALGMGAYIALSEAERNAGGDNNDHILADVMESVIGAMYLDGGFEPCETFILKGWGDRFYKMSEPPRHPKTQVQEWAQARGLTLPKYEISGQSGPDHAPVFEVSLSVGSFDKAYGSGRSRQEAEKEAAASFMEGRDE